MSASAKWGKSSTNLTELLWWLNELTNGKLLEQALGLSKGYESVNYDYDYQSQPPYEAGAAVIPILQTKAQRSSTNSPWTYSPETRCLTSMFWRNNEQQALLVSSSRESFGPEHQWVTGRSMLHKVCHQPPWHGSLRGQFSGTQDTLVDKEDAGPLREMNRRQKKKTWGQRYTTDKRRGRIDPFKNGKSVVHSSANFYTAGTAQTTCQGLAGRLRTKR